MMQSTTPEIASTLHLFKDGELGTVEARHPMHPCDHLRIVEITHRVSKDGMLLPIEQLTFRARCDLFLKGEDCVDGKLVEQQIDATNASEERFIGKTVSTVQLSYEVQRACPSFVENKTPWTDAWKAAVQVTPPTVTAEVCATCGEKDDRPCACAAQQTELASKHERKTAEVPEACAECTASADECDARKAEAMTDAEAEALVCSTCNPDDPVCGGCTPAFKPQPPSVCATCEDPAACQPGNGPCDKRWAELDAQQTSTRPTQG